MKKLGMATLILLFFLIMNIIMPQIVLGNIPLENTSYTASFFGIVGDGHTNVSPKLKKALNSIALNGGGTLMFDPGVYVIDDQVEVPSNITLIGNNTVFQMNSKKNIMLSLQGKVEKEIALTRDAFKDENIIYVEDVSSFSIGDNILIDGKIDYLKGDSNFEFNEITEIRNNSAIVLKESLKDNYKASDGYSVCKINFRENITIKNIDFRSSNSDNNTAAIRLKYCKNIDLSELNFSDIRHGIYAEVGNNVNITNSAALNIDTFSYFIKVKQAHITNNDIRYAKVGIRVLRNSDYSVIRDNNIICIKEHGILYNNWNDYGLISGNTISQCGIYGLCHDRNNRYTIIENNDISDTGNTALAVSSTIIDDCYIIVRNNYIHDTKSRAFTFEVVSYSEFTNNIIKNIGDESRWYHGVHFIPKADYHSSYNLIANNTFENILGESVKMNSKDNYYTTNNIIRDNKFINVYRGIIANEYNDNITISDNEFNIVDDIVLRISKMTNYQISNNRNINGKEIENLENNKNTYGMQDSNLLSLYTKSQEL